MTEISKMFKNAGINATARTKEVRHNLFACGLFYPDFTAEKQLLLIQLLAKTRIIHISFLSNEWSIEGMGGYGIKDDTFENALSGYINQIWQYLTDQEKEEIRRILNE